MRDIIKKAYALCVRAWNFVEGAVDTLAGWWRRLDRAVIGALGKLARAALLVLALALAPYLAGSYFGYRQSLDDHLPAVASTVAGAGLGIIEECAGAESECARMWHLDDSALTGVAEVRRTETLVESRLESAIHSSVIMQLQMLGHRRPLPDAASLAERHWAAACPLAPTWCPEGAVGRSAAEPGQ